MDSKALNLREAEDRAYTRALSDFNCREKAIAYAIQRGGGADLIDQARLIEAYLREGR